MIQVRTLLAQHVLALGTVRLRLDGRGLVVLSGPPNVGKSSLLTAVRSALDGTALPANAGVPNADPRVELEIEIDGQPLVAEANAEPDRRLADLGDFPVYDLDDAVFGASPALEWEAVDWAIGAHVWSRASQWAAQATTIVRGQIEHAQERIAATRPHDLPRELEDRATLKAELHQAIAARELVDANVADHENAIQSAEVRIQTAQREIDRMLEVEAEANRARARQEEREALLAQIAELEAKIPADALRPDFAEHCRAIYRRLEEAQAQVDLPGRAADAAGDCPACLRPFTDEERAALREVVERGRRAVTLWQSRAELARWSSALLERVAPMKRSVPPEIAIPAGFRADRMDDLRASVDRLTAEREQHRARLDEVRAQVEAARARHDEAQRRWDAAQGDDESDEAQALEQAGWIRAATALTEKAAALEVAHQRVFGSLITSRRALGLEALNRRLERWIPFPARLVASATHVELQIADPTGIPVAWEYASRSMRKAALAARHLALWDVACGAGVAPGVLFLDGVCEAIRPVIDRFRASVGLTGRTLVLVAPADQWSADEVWTAVRGAAGTEIYSALFA